MSEQRFHQFGLWVIDNPNFNGISIADLVDTELMPITEVVDLLNDQQATIIELKDDKNHLYKAIIKLRQEVAELKTRNAVLSSELNKIPERIKREWLDE